MFTPYQPVGNSILHTIIALIFYLLMFGFALYSFLAIFALVKYGRSRLLVFGISILYLIIVSGLYAVAQTNLGNLTF